jgi:ELWxxDGT repeat protein
MADSTGALWRTDGTVAGTTIYTNKVLVDSSAEPVLWNNKIYFKGITASTGKELWVTDGTDAGTQIVKDIKPGTASSSPRSLLLFNNALYFFASTSAEGVELWKSDGTNEGTVMVKDINPGAGNGYDNTNTSFFSSGAILYFNANDGTHGTELWKTDGSNIGTVMIKDINPGVDSSNCSDFTTLGSNIIFYCR